MVTQNKAVPDAQLKHRSPKQMPSFIFLQKQTVIFSLEDYKFISDSFLEIINCI